jgi:DNA-binding winged helix-turn-helix (wHTH) protein
MIEDCGHHQAFSRGSVLSFGSFRLDRANFSLYRADDNGGWLPVAMRPKAFDVLSYLATNPGRLIAPEEFMGSLWPGIHVQQEVVKAHILAARSALGDDPDAPLYIETMRGRGYRFIAEVSSEHEQDDHAGRASIVSTSPTFVGRGRAIEQLAELFRLASDSRAQIVFITGEAGIGKTTLAKEFLHSVASAGAAIAVGRCFSGTADTDAYGPLLETLSQLQRGDLAPAMSTNLPVLAPTWLVQLSDLSGGAVTANTRRDVFGSTPHRVNRELCDLLEALSKETLLVLLIEDLQWADRATLDFLKAIASRTPESRLMLLLTLRAPHRERRAEQVWLLSRSLLLYKKASEVSLETLDEEDVAKFLTGVAGHPAPPDLARHLHTRSGGNPLFLNAIFDLLLHDRRIAHGPSGWSICLSLNQTLAVPPSLADLIAGEVGKLDDRLRDVLEVASLAEGSFTPLIYAAGLQIDEDQFEVVCEELLRRTTFIRRGDVQTVAGGRTVQSYEFRHSLFRLVVYDRQIRSRRAMRHARVADRLVAIFEADGSISSEAARHYLAAERWSDAVDHLQRVSRNVMQRFSNREAATALERALSLVQHLPKGERDLRHVELLEDLARVYVGALDSRAAAVYERLAHAAERVTREDILCRALLGRAFALAWTDCEASMPIWQEAIVRSATLKDPIARARIRTAAHGWRNWAAGWSADDAAGCEAALGELRRIGDVASINASLVDFTLVLFPSARYVEAYDTITNCFAYLTEKGLDQRVDISLPLWIWRLGRPWSLMCAGRLGEALLLFDAGIEGFLANGEVGRAATLQFYKAFCCFHAGQHNEALRLCQQARNSFGKTGGKALSPNEEFIGAVSEGLANLGAGKLAEAKHLLEVAQQLVSAKRTLSTWHWRMVLEWGLTDVALALGQVDDAAEHARALRSHALATQETTWRVLAYEGSARAAVQLDDLVAARKYLTLGWQEAADADVPLARWRLDRVQGLWFAAQGEVEKAAYHAKKAKGGLQSIVSSLSAGPQIPVKTIETAATAACQSVR